MKIRICKFNSGFFFLLNIWRYLLASEWRVIEQKKRCWWMTERLNWSPECSSQRAAPQARNDTFLSTHDCFHTLKPCALITPPWLINFAVFFHNQSCSPDTFTHASKWRVRAKLVRETVLKGMVVPCKPMRLQSVPQHSESGCDQILFSLSLI